MEVESVKRSTTHNWTGSGLRYLLVQFLKQMACNTFLTDSAALGITAIHAPISQDRLVTKSTKGEVGQGLDQLRLFVVDFIPLFRENR